MLETDAFAEHPGVAWYLKPDGYRVHFGFWRTTVVRRRVTARRRAEGPTVEPLPSKPNNVIKRALRRPTEQQRSAARSDIDAAITDLADRGVVTDQEASVARGAGLAALATRMLAWQERQKGRAAGSAPRMGSGTH